MSLKHQVQKDLVEVMWARWRRTPPGAVLKIIEEKGPPQAGFTAEPSSWRFFYAQVLDEVDRYIPIYDASMGLVGFVLIFMNNTIITEGEAFNYVFIQ